MTQQEIEQLINGCRSNRPNKHEYLQQLKSELEKNPSFVSEIIIKRTSNLMFRILTRDIPLSEEIVTKRRHLESEIIKDYQNQNLDKVKEAMADILFGDNAKNGLLDIKTLRDRAELDPEFKKEYQKYQKLFDLYEKLYNLDANCPKDEVLEVLEQIVTEMNSLGIKKEDIPKVVDGLLNQARSASYEEIAQRVNGSDILQGVQPQVVKTKDGKEVNFYVLKKQGQNQQNFTLITRSTNSFDYVREDSSMQTYVENAARKNYYSYSLISDSRIGNSFSTSNGRVMLGYSKTGQGELLSCNTRDGQTNQWEISNDILVLQQDYLTVDELLKRTGAKDYNEIVITQPETMKPTMVICGGPEPTEREIAVASALGIPLVYIDREYYSEMEAKANDESAVEFNAKWRDNVFTYDLAPVNAVEIAD